MLDHSVKMIFVYISLRFCTVEFFINQYTICIIRMKKYMKHPASENLSPRINSYLLKKCIHFLDILEIGESYNCSSKIHPINEHTVERWQSFLTLGRNILIGVTLHLWMERLKWKQFTRTKRARFGITTFVLADTCTGYVGNQ